jgi:hypothetical protein
MSVNGTKALVVIEPRCDRCKDVMDNQLCLGCNQPLNKKRELYCFGPQYETWHKCVKCGEKK